MKTFIIQLRQPTLKETLQIYKIWNYKIVWPNNIELRKQDQEFYYNKIIKIFDDITGGVYTSLDTLLDEFLDINMNILKVYQAVEYFIEIGVYKKIKG